MEKLFGFGIYFEDRTDKNYGLGLGIKEKWNQGLHKAVRLILGPKGTKAAN